MLPFIRRGTVPGLTFLCLVGCGAKTPPAAPESQRVAVSRSEFLYDLPPLRRADHVGPGGVIEAYATYGQ